MGRFQREAEVLASLDHPNIGQIYGIEEAGQTKALVLQLIEGPTLAERIAQGPIPVEDALKIALQMAEGLEAAHEKGVIHRDLKPANIKITPEGQVKILDFGLAKAMEAEVPDSSLSQSPTLTAAATQAGVILGTAAYMSPEQAKGKAVDKRADIFAFGAVLYEMLTGKRAFEGEDVSDTLASILARDPDWKAVSQRTPTRVRELMADCLEKDSDGRLRDIGQARIQIQKAQKEPAATPPAEVADTVPPIRQRWAMIVGLVLLGAVISGIGVWSLTSPRTSPEPSLKRFLIGLPSTVQLSSSGLVLSPDGRTLVYTATQEGIRHLYRRSMDQLEAVPIPGTETASIPFFSPDGQWVGFFTDDDKLKKVSLSGGATVTLYELSSDRRGASWGQDDNIVFSGLRGGLLRVPSAGGSPQEITVLGQDENGHYWMDLLPGDKTVLFTVWSGSLDTARIAVQSLESGERKILVDGTSPHYAPSGHIVFAKLGSLWAVPFDVERLEVTGSPAPVLEGIQINAGGYASFTVSRDGSLVYMPGTAMSESELVWVDREGIATPLTQTKRGFLDPRLSPDGRYLSVTIDDGSRNTDIWIYEIDRGTLSPLTFGDTGESNAWPIWSLDSKQITFGFQGQSAGLFTVPADGSSEAIRLTTTTNVRHVPTSWSPEDVLAYAEGTSGEQDIHVLPLEGNEEAEPFLVTEFNEQHPMFSPDGQWIAFSSNRSGRKEVYVKPYPGEGGIFPISTGGGHQPVWARSGEELFYRIGGKMMVVSIQTEPIFQAGTPQVLFEDLYSDSFIDLTSNYDVSLDDQRFVMVKSEQASEQVQIHLVQNWFEELKRLVQTN